MPIRLPARARSRSALAVGSLVVIFAVGGALVLVRPGPAEVGSAQARSSFGLEEARAFDDFPLYYAGPRVDGLPLTAVVRRNDTVSYVSFVYGDCEAARDVGCTPPAEIQVWPACLRSLALYDDAAGSPVPKWVHVRGVRGAFFDRGTRLELETGASLVAVFAGSRARVLRIATELRAVDGSVEAGAPLPRMSGPRGGERGGAMGC